VSVRVSGWFIASESVELSDIDAIFVVAMLLGKEHHAFTAGMRGRGGKLTEGDRSE
jgi:hypothetical protein